MMKRNFATGAIGLCVVASIALGQGPKVKLTAPDGVWEVTRIAEYLLKAQDANTWTLRCTGKPLVMDFNNGERVFRAPQVDAKATRSANQWILQSLSLAGGVTGSQTKEGKALSVTAQNATLRTQGLGAQRLNLSGAVRVRQTDPAKGVVVDVQGDEGFVTQDLKGGRSGELNGNVHMIIESRSPKGKTVKLDATCRNMTYSLVAPPYRIVLKDRVMVKGTDAAYIGESQVEEMEILLGADYQPIQLKGSGSPGTESLEKVQPR